MKFKLSKFIDTKNLIERLGNAGCDDAVIGTGRPGHIALDFARDASSIDDAIVSALIDVKKVIPDAELIEARPAINQGADVAAVPAKGS